MAVTGNPFGWVEIYVLDMPRAIQFYEHTLQVKLTPLPGLEEDGDFEMVSFPWEEGSPNISGALVKTSGHGPGGSGTVAYFSCDDCALELSRVVTGGGSIIKEKFAIGEYGFCGIASDTEGNIIGFHSMK